MQSLNKSDESKLLNGVKLAATYVDKQGMTPNDALVKVSEELSCFRAKLARLLTLLTTDANLRSGKLILLCLISWPSSLWQTLML